MNEIFIDKNIAKKYAQAFMNTFPKSCSLNDMKKIEIAQKFLQTHKRTLFFLQLPQFDENRKKSMIADLVAHFSLPENIGSLISLLIYHNRSFYIPDVLSWIIQLYKNQTNSMEFFIATTQEISSDHIEEIKRFLHCLVNKKIIATPIIDHSLIAGIRLQSTEYRWEYSVLKQIKALQQLRTQ
jgi:ATP synthase F1 delta subunit